MSNEHKPGYMLRPFPLPAARNRRLRARDDQDFTGKDGLGLIDLLVVRQDLVHGYVEFLSDRIKRISKLHHIKATRNPNPALAYPHTHALSPPRHRVWVEAFP